MAEASNCQIPAIHPTVTTASCCLYLVIPLKNPRSRCVVAGQHYRYWMRRHSDRLARLLACILCCRCFACAGLPACHPNQGTSQVSSPQACKRFVSLLEDQTFCSLDQSQNCCIALDAAVQNQCQCWEGFPRATIVLLDLLSQQCSSDSATTSSASTLGLKIFFGVLTGSANFEQRQAGVRKASRSPLTLCCLKYHKYLPCSEVNLGAASIRAPCGLLLC